MLLNQTDIDFIFAQLTLPGNDPRNAPLGTVLDPTGIRDVGGVGNNVGNPLSGAVDQAFERLTNVDGEPVTGGGTTSTVTPPPAPPSSGPVGAPPVPAPPSITSVVGVPNAGLYADRNPNLPVVDSNPRIVSNLVADQSAEALAAIGYDTAGEQKLAVLDDPSTTPQGRLNPFTGAVNPLPFSTFTTMFGQFFDHGLDFVHKGADGVVIVPLLPNDPLFDPSQPQFDASNPATYSTTNVMYASRTNTIQVGIGAESTDTLITSLGLTNSPLDTRSADPITTTTFTGSGAGGVLMLNGVAVNVAAGLNLTQVVAAINANAALTGVTASDVAGQLKLTPDTNQSVNTVSPYIDLSQSYGSSTSHTVFLREYDANGKITGGLVSGADGGMATWADIKANAKKIGITLNDLDVLDIPEVRMFSAASTAAGGGYLDGSNQAWLVTRHLTTGEVYYVQNSDVTANTVVLNANGDVVTVDTSLLRLQTVGHAFLDDIAHSANLVNSRGQLMAADGDSVVNGDLNGNGVIDNGETPVANGTYDDELLAEHFVAGDGRANENIGLTSIHDVFHAEHNRVLEEITGFLTSVQTASIVIGNSGNNLVADLGIAENNTSTSAVLGSVVAGTVRGGNLVINNTTIAIANGSTLDQVVAAINAETGTVAAPGTGVAAVNNGGRLELLNEFQQDVHGNAWTGEMLFQAAKLVTEMEYQHLVFGEFVRKLSPNIAPFAAYDISIDPAITAEFAHAVYRFGHSMLTETVGLQSFDPVTGKPIADPVVNATALAVEADSNLLTVTVDSAHQLVAGNYVRLSGLATGLGGLSAADLTGSFKVVGVTDANTLVVELAKAAVSDESGTGLTDVKAVLDGDLGLIEAFLNPMAYSDTTAGEFAIGSSQQVGNGIDIWVTDALRNNLVGLPLDLATLNIVRGRDTGMLSLNGVREELYTATNGNATLKPYESWNEFKANLLHQETLVNFVMAYSRDAVLTQFADEKTLLEWDALKVSGTPQDNVDYATALRTAAEAAVLDGAFMAYDQGFNAIDFWLGGLAEAKVPGGMLGSTFDFIFAMQMIELQDGDRFYYLNRLGGTNLLAEIEAQLFSDIVMRNTGVENLYTDIFSVPDATVDMTVTQPFFNFFNQLANEKVNTTDILGNAVQVGTAGWAYDYQAGAWTFYGNTGDYLDARGVFSPNGAGNASEVIVGTDVAPQGGTNNDRIDGWGGNDTIWAKAGNDTVEGGKGNDFIHGGEGNDVISDSEGDDLIWGDAGDDLINAGSGLDQVFGGDGNDTLYGGTESDVIEGGKGDDLIFGDNGSAPSVVGDLNGPDILAGGEGKDTIYGGGGDDGLDGGEGDDVLYGGAGADLMTGWFGDDRFVMDASDIGFGNAMDGGLGFDTADYSASAGLGAGVGVTVNLVNLAPATVVPADSFIDVEGLIGSAYNDSLTGGAVIINVYTLDGAGNPTNTLDLFASTAASVGFQVANEFGDPLVAVVNGVETLVAMDYQIDGGAGNDIVVGGEGHDTLIGGTGTDTLTGGLGDDTYVVEGNADVVVELLNEGIDTIVVQNAGDASFNLAPTGGPANVALAAERANIENLSYEGSGNFNGTGNALDNVIAGGAGSDTLNGGAGNDTLIGGAGNDSYTVDAAGDVVAEVDGGGIDTVTATVSHTLGANVENLTLGGNQNINGTGNSLANTITGNAGANVLTGAGGADTLIGGTGNDTYVLTNLTDTVVTTEAANSGTDTILVQVDGNATFSLANRTNIENLTYEGTGNFNGTGSAGNNVITGAGGADTLSGADGTDSLVGNAGNDSLLGGAGNDTLNGGAGSDTLVGGTGADALSGGAGNDVFVFTAAGDSGTTGGTRDTIADFAVGDLIDVSGIGTFTFIGTNAFTSALQLRATTSLGNTLVEGNTVGNTGAEFSIALTGTQTLTANSFIGAVAAPVAPVVAGQTINGNGRGNTLTGNGGNDVINGNGGNDVLTGGAGNDVIMGGTGNDVINGGTGNDVLMGGTGNDAFVFNAALGAGNVDVISDFTNSGNTNNDVIRLENAVFTALTQTGTLAANAFTSNTTGLATAAAHRVIYNTTNGALNYDADGSIAGSQAQQFATLTGGVTGTALSNVDFVVI
ncbi:MAG: peroxidase family protein [Hydrogenophaga sp.]|nr:peroxidase family protein [Hydrogenophaga sp.]